MFVSAFVTHLAILSSISKFTFTTKSPDFGRRLDHPSTFCFEGLALSICTLRIASAQYYRSLSIQFSSSISQSPLAAASLALMFLALIDHRQSLTSDILKVFKDVL
jgi:hypothetical protein